MTEYIAVLLSAAVLGAKAVGILPAPLLSSAAFYSSERVLAERAAVDALQTTVSPRPLAGRTDASSGAMATTTLEATIEPEWLGWKGIRLVCRSPQYQAEASVSDGKAGLRMAIWGTIERIGRGRWLVSYSVDLRVADGDEVRRIAVAGAGVWEEDKPVRIVTASGWSVILRISPTNGEGESESKSNKDPWRERKAPG